MLGSSVLAGSSPAQSRVFVYEVTGLKQNVSNDSNSYQFRSSSSIFVKVPYKRMNEEMQRINKMGGTIIKIHSLEEFQNQSSTTSEATTDDSED